MKILKCPFCSSTLLGVGYSLNIKGIRRFVFCRCGAHGPMGKSESDAISQWNSRMDVLVYDPSTLINPQESSRTAAYIEALKRDGFGVETIPCRIRDQEPTK